MKKYVLATIVAVFFTSLFPISAFAQWDYGQNSIDNIIESRIDARKTRERIRARQAKSKSSKAKSKISTGKSKSSTAKSKTLKAKAVSRPTASKTSAKVVKRPAPAVKPVVAPLPHHDIAIPFDTFQDFHLDDTDGYTVTFNFVPTGGKAKTIVKTYNYNYMKYRHAAEYNDIPVGTYTVSASAVYKGKKYPVHLATQEGTSTDSKGGNFAPSVQLVVKPAEDMYGDMVIQGFPNTIYSRVIE